jgi:hypothetical protein
MTPIAVKPIGEVQKLRERFSVKNSEYLGG